MRKKVLLSMVSLICVLALHATDVPTLQILKTNTEQVNIPISSIKKITYDKAGLATMFVETNTATQSYSLSEVVKMTLQNLPGSTALEQWQADDVPSNQKVMVDGVVYIVKDGKIYTIKGEQIQ